MTRRDGLAALLLRSWCAGAGRTPCAARRSRAVGRAFPCAGCGSDPLRRRPSPLRPAAAPELQITWRRALRGPAGQGARPHHARRDDREHAPDTGAARTYFDTAYLAVLPGTANFAASSPGADRRRSRSASDELVHAADDRRSGDALTREAHAIHAAVRPARPRRDGDPGRPRREPASSRSRSGPSPRTTRPAAASPSSSRPATTSSNRSERCAGPRTATTARSSIASGALEGPAEVLLLLRGRPPGRVRRDVGLVGRGGRHPVAVTVRALVRRPGVGTRVGSLVKRGLPALGAAIGLPTAATGLVVQEAVSRTIGGYAGLYDPVAGDDPGRLLRGSVRGAARGGARVVQRPARRRTAGSRRPSRRGTRSAPRRR